MSFQVTREMCGQCEKQVYPTEKMVLEGMVIHKSCFICLHCKRKLTVGNFAAVNGRIYCKVHYLALFKEHGGRYDKAFGAFQSGKGGQPAGPDTVKAPSADDEMPSIVSEKSLNESAIDAMADQSMLSAVNKSVMDASVMSELSIDSTASSMSVKARREMLERKASSSTAGAASGPNPPIQRENSAIGSSIRSIASAFEKQPSSASMETSSEPALQEKPSFLGSSKQTGSVKSLAGALAQQNIVSRLGQAMPSKPAAATAPTDTSSMPVEASSSTIIKKAHMEEEEEEPLGMSHATMARPMVPSSRRRKPTVEKDLFSSPAGRDRKHLRTEEEAEGSSNSKMEGERILFGTNLKSKDDEDIPENVMQEDIGMAWLPNAKLDELRVVLRSAFILFSDLEAKKYALEVLIKQKQLVIRRLKEQRKLSASASVEDKQQSTEVKANPNESSSDHQVEEIEDEDVFLAAKLEQEGDIDAARQCHLKALERATAADNENHARIFASYASFMVRHYLDMLNEDDNEVQRVADAFDSLENFKKVRDTVEAERAVFLSQVLHFSDEALEAFRRAYELYSSDAEVLCNYAQFLNKTLSREAMLEGDEKEARELKATAADMYREAIELQPDVELVRSNLAAILVQLSHTASSEEERLELLGEAKQHLEHVSESRNPMILYNLSCVLSLLGDLDDARKTLEGALEINPSFVGDMEEDPDLSALRGLDWFKPLVSKYSS